MAKKKAGGGVEHGIASPLKWHGGKFYLAKRIVQLMPRHTHYVEPFAGSLAVMLAKDPEGVSEVANDLDGRLSNFWRALVHPDAAQILIRVLEVTPFSEPAFREAMATLEKPCTVTPPAVCTGCAEAFFVACRQSLAGRMESFAPLTRRRTRQGRNEQAAAWLSAVDRLPEVHRRLRRVAVLNRDALDVIRQQDGPETLFYLDPPYLAETRSVPSVYRFEMSDVQHFELLETVRQCAGKVLLSGYRSAMYDDRLKDWNRHDFDLANHAASVLGPRAKKRRATESLWVNF